MTIVTARDRAMRLPGIAVLAGYRREWLRGDHLAGVAVAAYLVPQVMAYSGIAGLPPQAGLWACLGSLAIYAVLGSSRQLSVGPESTTALMTAAGARCISWRRWRPAPAARRNHATSRPARGRSPEPSP